MRVDAHPPIAGPVFSGGFHEPAIPGSPDSSVAAGIFVEVQTERHGSKCGSIRHRKEVFAMHFDRRAPSWGFWVIREMLEQLAQRDQREIAVLNLANRL